MSDDHELPVVLYRAKDMVEAQELHDALEDAGILARVEGEYLGSALGDLPLGVTTAPRVVVRAADELRARGVLEEMLRQKRKSPTADSTDLICLACGSDMSTAETCPQCGWTFQIPPAE